MNITSIFIRPLLTEKATQLAKGKTYAFEIHEKATKKQVFSALETLYKVKVSKVRIVKKGKKVRKVGRKMMPKVARERKVAYITLKEGKIDLFPET